MEVSKSAWIVNSILTPLGLLYPFQNGKGMIYPFGVGYCPMLADRSFHNLYSGEKTIVPRQFIKTLITNATSGNKFAICFFLIMAKNDKQWSSATPGLLIILVDKSGSMMLKYKNEPVSRTEFATRVINRVINDIIKKNFNGKEPKNRCFISVISYCAEVKEECSGFLTDLYKSPKRIETVTKKVSDGAGSLVDKIVKMPIWVEPTDTDTWTDMRGAFVMAKKLVESWMADKPDNPAPVIINISDGVPYYDHKSNSVCVEETKAVANEIMNISNSDGNVLIFNAEIGDTSKEIITPCDDNDVKNGGQGAEFLYEISSVIPEGYIDAAHKNELPVKPNSRGCVFSADAVSLIKLIDFGSSKGLGDK